MCFALAACGKQGPDAGAAGTDGGRIECAIGAKTDWTRDCVAERKGEVLTLRHADGGFRRFHIVKDGRGLVPADGAEQATIDIAGDRQIDVTVGDARYRLPATIAGVSR